MPIVADSEKPKDNKRQVMLAQQGLEEIPKQLLSQNTGNKLINIMDLSRNEITEIPSVLFLHFRNLEMLVIQNNKLVALNSDIIKLKHLKVLKLDGNLLSALPYSIGKLSTLEQLSVSRNSLVTVPMSIAELANTLKILDLSSNSIQFLPVEIGKLRVLRILYLDQNMLETIPSSLSELDGLIELGLDWIYYIEKKLFRCKGDLLKSIMIELKKLAEKGISERKAEINCTDFIKALSDSTLNVEWRESGTDRTWLHIASTYNHLAVINSFIKNKADINALDKEQYTPLALAIKYHKTEAAFLLLSLNAATRFGAGPFGTPLHMAVFKSDLELVNELLKIGSDPNSLSPEIENTPLHYLFTSFDRSPYRSGMIADALLKHGADPNIKNKKDWAPIHIAIKKEQPKAIKWILHWNSQTTDPKYKFDLNLQGGCDKQTVLHLAVRAERSTIVLKLINNGANMFERNIKRRTPRQTSKRNTGIYKIIERAEAWYIRKKMGFEETFGDMKVQDESSTQMVYKFTPFKQKQVTLRSHNSLKEDTNNDKDNNAKKVNVEKAPVFMRNKLIDKVEFDSMNLPGIKDKILNNRLKLYERYDALNNLKCENSPQATKIFSEVLSKVLSISNYGLRQDIIQLSDTMIFTGIIRILEELLHKSSDKVINETLAIVLEKVKQNIIENIKMNKEAQTNILSLSSGFPKGFFLSLQKDEIK